jgi:hypothetical protein
VKLRSFLFVPFLAVLGSASALGAQTTQATKVPPAAAPRSVHVIAGVITSVEPAADLVAVRESVPSASQMGQKPVRRSVALVVTPETKLILGKEPAAISDLKAGDFVVARYAETPQGALALTLRAAGAVVSAAPTPSATPQAGEVSAKDGGRR